MGNVGWVWLPNNSECSAWKKSNGHGLKTEESLDLSSFHDFPEPSAEEREQYLEENAKRGTLHLVEYRNSMDGKRAEMALEIELGIAYGRINPSHGNQYTLRS